MNPPLDNTCAVITGPNEASLTIEPISARPGPGEVLIKTHYSLLSPGTELAIFQHTHIGFEDPNHSFARYPFRPGYATVGRIEALGEGVTGLAEGAWVFTRGRHSAYSIENVGKGIVLPLPEGIDPKLALFARMAQISASSVEISPAATKGPVIVLGLGLVGNLAAQLFQKRGREVLGVDLIAARCEIAQQCGLRALRVTPEDTAGQVRAAFAEKGAATVVEATGHPLAVATALQMTARGGETILLGSTRGKVELNVYKLIHQPGITVRGAHEGVIGLFGGPGRAKVLIEESLADIAAGRLLVAPLLSQVRPCTELQAAYRRLCDQPAETLSIVLQW